VRRPLRQMGPLLADDSGQAMAEYAIVLAGIFGLLIGASFTFLPDFFNALQRYYDSFYIMLNLPIP
jgi:Flp pilus assembly pilin Flp